MDAFLASLGASLLSVLVVVLLMVLGKKVDDIRTAFDDDELVCKQLNLAIGFRRAGLYLGIAIAMAGVLTGVGPAKLSASLTELALDGLAILVLLFLAREVNDRLILKSVRNDTLIEQNNIAVGIAELGSFIATALILNGSFSGDDGGLLVAAVFFVISQLALILLTALYGRHKAAESASLQGLVIQGNVAAGCVLAGVMIALGCILRVSASGTFVSWNVDLASFGITALLGVVLLVLLRTALGRVFVPRISTSEAIAANNVSAVLIIEGVVVSLAIILMMAL